ncbi:MAG: Wzy polymerase domain-containing protein [Gemmatimonadota bacterium]
MSRILSGVAVAGTCALCYANSLHGAFHYDDFHSIVENRAVRSLGNVPRFFVDPTAFSADSEKAMYRPLLLVTYALNHRLGGYGVEGYHVVNIGLHAAAALLVWLLARQLWPGRRAALVAALLFAVHPLATEPVNYISSRSELLAATLYLAALLLYLRRDAGGPQRLGSLACFALALLSKSTAVTLPAVLLAYEYLRADRRRAWRQRLAGPARALRWYWLLAAGYLATISLNGFLGHSLESPVRGGLVQLATQLKALPYYLKLLFYPWGLSVEHQFAESTSLGDGTVLAGFALVASLVGVALAAPRRSPMSGAAAASWSLLVLLPASAMPLNVLVNERRLYLVVAVLALALAGMLGRRERWAIGLCLPVLALLTASRNHAWESELSLWEDAAARAPRMPRVQTNLGKALQQAGDWDGALAAYERSLALDDRHGDAYNNIGTVLHQRGDLALAIDWYERGIERYPRETRIYLNLAQALAQQGQVPEALQVYARALAIDPGDATAWSNYAEALLRRRDWAGAAQAARRAVELAPERPEPYNNLANAYSAMGDDAGAVRMYALALERAEQDRAAILVNLADSELRLGDNAAARAALEQALAADPRSARGHYHLGRVESGDGHAEAAAGSWRRALELDSTYVPAMVALGEMESELGDAAAAAAWLRRAAAREPDNARAWYGLAMALDRLGQPAEARRAYREFMTVWPQRDDRYERAELRVRELGGGD